MKLRSIRVTISRDGAWVGERDTQLEIYKFATDSQFGSLEACCWNDACEQLEAMVPDQAIDNGAWGWVEDEEGRRFAINCDGDESRGM